MKKVSHKITLNQKKRNNNYPHGAAKFLFQIEPKHFWFLGRNTIIENCVRQVYRDVHGKSFLEVGCGTGFVLSAMEKIGFTVTGMDMYREALQFATKRTNATLVCSDLENYQSSHQFDAVGAFDVVEHVKKDGRFIQQCRRLLNSQGTLFLTVPAGMELWSDFDVFSGHKRRYTLSSLRHMLESSGFNVIFIHYFGLFQYFPHIITKKFLYKDIKRNGSELAFLAHVLKLPSTVVNTVLYWSLIFESAIMNILPFPYGTSIIAVAKKVV